MWCAKCGKRLTDFEIMLGCLVCSGKEKLSPYIDKKLHERMMNNDTFINLVAMSYGVSPSNIRFRVATYDMDLYNDMYKRFKDMGLDKPKKRR